MSLPGWWICGSFHPHCVMTHTRSSSGTAARMKATPLSLVIVIRWSAPPDWLKKGHVCLTYRRMSPSMRTPRPVNQYKPYCMS